MYEVNFGKLLHDVQAGSVCATQIAQFARIQATRESDRMSTIQIRD